MRYVVLLISALAMSGCTGSWYVGEWKVADAKFPGISAMGMNEAREWFDSIAVYSASAVTFRSETCDDPQFDVELLTEDEFRNLYRATFADLGIEGEQAEVLHVGCPVNWISPGSTFIQATRDSGYILWDGVFFKVERVAGS